MTFLCNTSIRTCYSEKPDSLKFHCLFELVSFSTGANCQPFLPCLSWLLLFPMQDFYTSQRSVARLWFNKGGIGWFAGMHYPLHILIISFTISLYWLWLTFWLILCFKQIFLSTRWAILLNLHVEMFRVNKYPVAFLCPVIFVCILLSSCAFLVYLLEQPGTTVKNKADLARKNYINSKSCRIRPEKEYFLLICYSK